MKNTKVRFLTIAGLILIPCALVLWLYVSSASRPRIVSYTIKSVNERSANVEDAFNISLMTRDFVVSEGPCGSGDCNGGILSQQAPVDLKEVAPKLQGYDGESTTVIWLYRIKPLNIKRENDWAGDDTVTIFGKLTEEKKLYFAVVPLSIVEPRLSWVYVQTK